VFAYDGANIIEETDSSGNALARYSMGLNIDEPLAMLRSSATHFYNADGLGSITSLTDSSGATSATYRYDTFGNLTASSGSVTNPFRYTAREWDGEIGIYYYRARFFDLITGRFLSEDPAGFVGGINLYAYVANNPTNLIDPSGLDHGPYHPPKGVHTKCQKEDSCAVIKGKIWLLQRMIASHEGWDRTMPRPRGGNRHSQEIADRYVELAQCTALYAEKKCNDCEKKEPKWRPVPIPIVGPILDKITDPIADFLEEVWKELKVYPPRRPQPIWGPLPTPSPVPVPIVP
jgi:RHS repeat-associated protein